jgi:hypothetical protein
MSSKRIEIFKKASNSPKISLKYLAFSKNEPRGNCRIATIFPGHQVLEAILNESSKNTENFIIDWLRKETTRYFAKTKVYVVPLLLRLVFKPVLF